MLPACSTMPISFGTIVMLPLPIAAEEELEEEPEASVGAATWGLQLPGQQSMAQAVPGLPPPPEVARANLTRAQDAHELAALRLLARHPQARRVVEHEAHVGEVPLVDVPELALQSLLLRGGVVDRAHGPRPEEILKDIKH
jgi:hypothetical protein